MFTSLLTAKRKSLWNGYPVITDRVDYKQRHMVTS